MKTAAIIPARMNSSRFPGKPLIPILGKPMIQRVYERCALSTVIDEIVIATCDEEIRQAALGFGARVIMTSREHRRAIERVAEAARHIDADMILMVQGDEPTIVRDMLDIPLALPCVNLVAHLQPHDAADIDTIKVALDFTGRVLYMTRQPIPAKWKQVCVIRLTKDMLHRFVRFVPGELEEAESIDMLRFIENNVPVYTHATPHYTHAVDRPDDVPIVEDILIRQAGARHAVPLGE